MGTPRQGGARPVKPNTDEKVGGMLSLNGYAELRDLSIQAGRSQEALRAYVTSLEALRDMVTEEIEHLRGSGDA